MLSNLDVGLRPKRDVGDAGIIWRKELTYTAPRDYKRRTLNSSIIGTQVSAPAKINLDHHVVLLPCQSPFDWGSEHADSAFSPEEQFSLLETRMIARLPEKYCVVQIMRGVEGMSVAEVAECLRISRESVKVRLHRSRLTAEVAL